MEAKPPSDQKAVRVLVLARHFPPAVSGGARRSLMWTEAFQAFGADVFVVAPELPDGLPGAECPHSNPDPSTKLATRKSLRDIAREWLLWPDPDIRWVRRAERLAIAACPFEPTHILTTSPPESIHVAGAGLLGAWPSAQWLVDARDHWLVRAFRSERRSGLRNFIESMIAPVILRKADAVLAVNEKISAEFQRYAPSAKHLVVSHFTQRPKQSHAYEGDGVHLVHTGSFSLSDPDVKIETLLRDFETACASRSDLTLHLVGRLRADEREKVLASSASEQIVMHGVVALETALAMQAGASALAVVAAPKAPVPPGKMAEYTASGRPVIPFGTGPWRELVDQDQRSGAERLLEFDLAAMPEGMAKPASRSPVEIVRDVLASLSN
jgi:glycosyltransferase involved in cell wall biosynthesis